MKSFARVVIRDAQGRFLVLRESGRPYWNFPGGKVEPDESPLQAACRELLEEVEWSVSPTSLQLVTSGVFDILGTPWHGSFFFAHQINGTSTHFPSTPSVEFSKMLPEQLRMVDALPGVLVEIACLVEASGGRTTFTCA